MLTFSFPRPDKPWSTNQDRNLAPHQRYNLITSWKTATKIHYINYVNSNECGRTLEPGVVHVTIPFDRKPMGDPHNYCGTVLKAIIDGLVAGRAWPDDTPEFVGHREPTLVKGGQVVIEVTSMVIAPPWPEDTPRLRPTWVSSQGREI